MASHGGFPHLGAISSDGASAALRIQMLAVFLNVMGDTFFGVLQGALGLGFLLSFLLACPPLHGQQ